MRGSDGQPREFFGNALQIDDRARKVNKLGPGGRYVGFIFENKNDQSVDKGFCSTDFAPLVVGMMRVSIIPMFTQVSMIYVNVSKTDIPGQIDASTVRFVEDAGIAVNRTLITFHEHPTGDCTPYKCCLYFCLTSSLYAPDNTLDPVYHGGLCLRSTVNSDRETLAVPFGTRKSGASITRLENHYRPA